MALKWRLTKTAETSHLFRKATATDCLAFVLSRSNILINSDTTPSESITLNFGVHYRFLFYFRFIINQVFDNIECIDLCIISIVSRSEARELTILPS